MPPPSPPPSPTPPPSPSPTTRRRLLAAAGDNGLAAAGDVDGMARRALRFADPAASPPTPAAAVRAMLGAAASPGDEEELLAGVSKELRMRLRRRRPVPRGEVRALGLTFRPHEPLRGGVRSTQRASSHRLCRGTTATR